MTVATPRKRRPPREPKRPPTYAERAERYARAVVAGEIVACRFVKRACARHLNDLERQADDAFPYRYDPEHGNRICRFIEYLPHVKGSWAMRRERIKLEDWQCFIECVVFGWVRKTDGLRRFVLVYIEVPRKNAKSTLTAGTGLYMFAADGEFGAEVYSGATTEKQAWEVFGPARLMAKNTDDLRAEFGIDVHAKNLAILETASKFEPIIGKPGDGASPSFSITDEYHEHQTSEQFDTMLTGMGAREQPIAWVITTAGVDTAGPCYALRTSVVEILEGVVEEERTFGIIYTIDEGDDWTSEEALRKANPNFGVSVFGDFLLDQQQRAVNDPRNQSTFKTKHLNLWVGAAAPFFNLETWNRLGNKALRLDQFRGEACWVGVDLAAKLDIAGWMALFRRMVRGQKKPRLFAFGRFYVPEERAQDPELRHYAGWVAQGHLIATPGNVIDLDYIEDDLKRLATDHRIVQLGFDPYNAQQLATHLMNFGVECVEVPQTVPYLSEPMKELQAVIVDERIQHDANPLVAWGIGNVTAQMDRNDNVFPRKERPQNKIDPAVAAIIAMGRMLAGGEPKQSVYHTRGIRTI